MPTATPKPTKSGHAAVNGGGLKDAGWQREHMSQNRLAERVHRRVVDHRDSLVGWPLCFAAPVLGLHHSEIHSFQRLRALAAAHWFHGHPAVAFHRQPLPDAHRCRVALAARLGGRRAYHAGNSGFHDPPVHSVLRSDRTALLVASELRRGCGPSWIVFSTIAAPLV